MLFEPDTQKQTSLINSYAKQVIAMFQTHIEHMGFIPVLHFELEGTYTSSGNSGHVHTLDFNALNDALKSYPMQGDLKPEFWSCQWEWASRFEGQAPLKAAADLEMAISVLPILLKKYGAADVFIRPVMWNAVEGRMMQGSKVLFAPNSLPVHIPNSIQINISALNRHQQNAIPENGLGEQLQTCLLETSRECCLLYAPEEEAYERLSLKKKHALDKELSSPQDISGGHQGSIALYKELGKHNQKMGDVAQIYDADHNVLVSSQNWRPLSRVEHRLGSASMHYNPYVATVFALANLSDAILLNTGNSMHDAMRKQSRREAHMLPTSLFGEGEGAYALFGKSSWFENKINACAEYVYIKRLMQADKLPPRDIGTSLKKAILGYYAKLVN